MLHFVLINFKTWESFREGFKVRYVNSKWVEVRTRNSNQTIGRVIDLESPQKVAKLPTLQILYICLLITRYCLYRIDYTVQFIRVVRSTPVVYCTMVSLTHFMVENSLQIQREPKPNPKSGNLNSMKNKLFPFICNREKQLQADCLNERLYDDRFHLRKIFCLR